MSWSARSMLREMSKVAVMRAEPCLADEVISCTPVTCEIASSIGLMRPVSMSSGEAPGQETLTETVGLSTSGNWLTPILITARMPKRIVPAMIIQAKTGRRRQMSVMLIRSSAMMRRAAGPRRRSARRSLRDGAAVMERVERRVIGDLHRRAFGQRLDAAHDDLLALVDSARDLDVAVGRVHAELDDFGVRDVLRVDDVDDVPFFGRLHGHRRHDDRIARRADRNRDLAERARTQPVLVI